MKWIDVSGGCGGHNGEYDWKCSNCNYTDWQASNVDPNKHNTQCKGCQQFPEQSKKPTIVPDERKHELYHSDYHEGYVEGWNDCRKEILGG